MPVLRLFLDANVLFLAGYSRTSPVHDLIEVARAGRCELVASAYTLEEARRNLAVKSPDSTVDALNATLAAVTIVAEARSPASKLAADAEPSDPEDVPVLAAAIQCRANILVTGDRRAFARHFRTRLAGVEVLVLRNALRRVLGLPLVDAY